MKILKMLDKRLENTKGTIGSKKSKKYAQHNDQKKRDKRTINDLQHTTFSIKDNIKSINYRKQLNRNYL